MNIAFVIVALIGLVWWVSLQVHLHREEIRNCPGHEWKYIHVVMSPYSPHPTYNSWVRMCERCPAQEPVRDEATIDRLMKEYTDKTFPPKG